MLEREKELITKIEADVNRLVSISYISANPAVTLLFEIARDLQSLRQMMEQKEKQERDLWR